MELFSLWESFSTSTFFVPGGAICCLLRKLCALVKSKVPWRSWKSSSFCRKRPCLKLRKNWRSPTTANHLPKNHRTMRTPSWSKNRVRSSCQYWVHLHFLMKKKNPSAYYYMLEMVLSQNIVIQCGVITIQRNKHLVCCLLKLCIWHSFQWWYNISASQEPNISWTLNIRLCLQFLLRKYASTYYDYLGILSNYFPPA